MTKFEKLRQRYRTPQPCSPKELLRRKFNQKIEKLKKATQRRSDEATQGEGADDAADR